MFYILRKISSPVAIWPSKKNMLYFLQSLEQNSFDCERSSLTRRKKLCISSRRCRLKLEVYQNKWKPVEIAAKYNYYWFHDAAFANRYFSKNGSLFSKIFYSLAHRPSWRWNQYFKIRIWWWIVHEPSRRSLSKFYCGKNFFPLKLAFTLKAEF